MAGGIIFEDAVLDIDQIAAPGDVVGRQFDALGDGLYRTAAGIELGQGLAEHGHIGGIG